VEERAGQIDDLVEAGSLERAEGCLRLTERATLLANEVAARLL
jgi:coproporphyrinogen III oxidase-like Fe-S oxidoreductase